MSKLSQTFPSPPGGGLTVRLILMSVILVVVLGALIAVRRGMVSSPSAPASPQPAAPAEQPVETGPLQARIHTKAGSVELQLGARNADAPGTPGKVLVPTAPAPPDNATIKAPADDNDIFAKVLDGHHVTWEERDAYHHVVAMAWDLGQKGTAEQALSVRRSELLAEPKKYRARLIRVKGSLLRVRRRTFDPDEKRPDRPLVHYECAIKSAEDDPYIVLVFEDPLEKAGVRAGRDAVWTDAYFFKIWGYDNEKLKAPLLMGTRVHKLKIRDVLGPMASVVLGGFVVLVILLWLWLRRGRYQSESVRQRLAREDAEEVEIPEPASLPRDEDYDDQT